MDDQIKGSISINETILPIVDIYLRRGEIVFVGKIRGPVPATTTTSCVIYDTDGHVVTRGVDLPPISWPAIPEGKGLAIHMPLLMRGIGGANHVGSDHPYHRMKRAEEETFGAPFEPMS